MLDLKKITTEGRNERTKNIDAVDTLTLVKLINDEDKTVPLAVEKILPDIARAVDVIAERLSAGGRLFYIGAGTSGRLGVLDAAECPPTFGVAPDLVVGLIAGGENAMFVAVEGAEDDEGQAEIDLKDKNFSRQDVLVGIAASGRTPYVIGALKYAGKIGAATISLTATENSAMSKYAEINLAPITGPEVITGSTRLKAGTAAKLVLNMLSTGTMIKLGKVYGNLMVDVKATNEKLKARALNIVKEATGETDEKAAAALKEADGSAKLAIFMLLTGLNKEIAMETLAKSEGKLALALTKYKEEQNGK